MSEGRLAYPLTPPRPILVGKNRPAEQSALEFVLSGELDLSSVPELLHRLTRALQLAALARDTPPRVVLDLRRLTFIDAAGIQALLAIRRRCAARGISLSLRFGNTPVRRTLSAVGISELLELADEGIER